MRRGVMQCCDAWWRWWGLGSTQSLKQHQGVELGALAMASSTSDMEPEHIAAVHARVSLFLDPCTLQWATIAVIDICMCPFNPWGCLARFAVSFRCLRQSLASRVSWSAHQFCRAALIGESG